MRIQKTQSSPMLNPSGNPLTLSQADRRNIDAVANNE